MGRLVASVLRGVSRAGVSVCGATTINIQYRKTSTSPKRSLYSLYRKGALSTPNSRVRGCLPSSFSLVRSPSVLCGCVLFAGDLFRVFLGLQVYQRSVVRLFYRIVRSPQSFHRLLYGYGPTFSRPIVPRRVLPFFAGSLVRSLGVLNKATAYSRPFATYSLSALFVTFLRNASRVLATPRNFPNALSPTSLSLVASKACDHANIQCSAIRLSSTRGFLAMERSMRYVHGLPRKYYVPFRFFLLKVTFAGQRRFFFFLHFSQGSDFYRIPRCRRCTSCRRNGSPFLRVFPSPCGLR